jgi:hypothetical protein
MRFPLHEAQNAYQRGKSCETALYDLLNRIEEALRYKIFAFGTFLDIEGAFDNTSFTSMITASHEQDVDWLSPEKSNCKGWNQRRKFYDGSATGLGWVKD